MMGLVQLKLTLYADNWDTLELLLMTTIPCELLNTASYILHVYCISGDFYYEFIDCATIHVAVHLSFTTNMLFL